MRQVLPVSRAVVTDGCVEWELHYLICCQPGKSNEKGYGLKITSRSLCKQATGYEAETEALTHSYAQAHTWAQQLAQNGVTPLTLHDVVDDWVG